MDSEPAGGDLPSARGGRPSNRSLRCERSEPRTAAQLTAPVERFLEVYGPDICAGEWGKPLGSGLYEFRVSKSLAAIYSAAGVDRSPEPGDERRVLIRLFCTFYGDKIVLIYHGYDKGRDSSSRRQKKEIAKARAAHIQWKQTKR